MITFKRTLVAAALLAASAFAVPTGAQAKTYVDIHFGAPYWYGGGYGYYGHHHRPHRHWRHHRRHHWHGHRHWRHDYYRPYYPSHGYSYGHRHRYW